MLKKLFFGILFFGLISGNKVFADNAKTQGTTKTVIMKSISFDPKILEVKVGDAVVWENRSYTEHSATADEKNTFDTGLIGPTKSTKKIEFKQAGTFKYHCSMHGKTMSGQIVVAP